MAIIKRNRSSTTQALVEAMQKLCILLASQDDDEAIEQLQAAAEVLKKPNGTEDDLKAAIDSVIDAFEGDHELIAYTHQRDSKQWTEIEELSQASSRVLTLARRIRPNR
ncbi:MAG: hypothetical protein HRU19_07475 [Pseudobacteriovorax sp.]|nr:hypothetical protein [Pseudobacteriovorax sp.]